jgi:hypothetical protein
MSRLHVSKLLLRGQGLALALVAAARFIERQRLLAG